MATSGDLYMATSGDFFMATDTLGGTAAGGCTTGYREATPWP